MNPLPPALATFFATGGSVARGPAGPKVGSQAGKSAVEIRLLRLKSAAARSAQGDRDAALELCAVLENRQELESLRVAAALMLAGAQSVPEATRCLTPVALSREESPQLRGAAMLSLANIGGADAARTLRSLLFSREAEGIAVQAHDLGGRVTLQRLAAMLLFDFEGLHGRGILDRIARHPEEYLSPWEEAMAVVFHTDTAGYLQAMLDILWSPRYSEKVRLTVLEAYTVLLADPEMPIEGAKSWWDSLASIAAARNTESPRIREMAAAYLKKYRPPR